MGTQVRMSGERLPRAARLRRGVEIQELLRRGDRRRGALVDLFVVRQATGRPRVGVVVPCFGHSHARRNQVKRRIREILRREWLPGACASGLDADVLVRVRRRVYEEDYSALRDALLSGLPRIPC